MASPSSLLSGAGNSIFAFLYSWVGLGTPPLLSGAWPSLSFAFGSGPALPLCLFWLGLLLTRSQIKHECSPSKVVDLQSNAASQAASVAPCVFAPNQTVCLQLGQLSSARSRGPSPRCASGVKRNGPVVCVPFPLDMWVAMWGGFPESHVPQCLRPRTGGLVQRGRGRGAGGHRQHELGGAERPMVL